jgi:hypothetical protein
MFQTALDVFVTVLNVSLAVLNIPNVPQEGEGGSAAAYRGKIEAHGGDPSDGPFPGQETDSVPVCLKSSGLS